MADSKPFRFANFKGAVDENFIDVDDISPEFVSKTTNLTPFRKAGSLVQCPGLSTVSYPTLPAPTGYKVINLETFSIDRDNKEITMLVLESISTGEIKMYITPYWNPATTYSNNNPNKTAESWVNEWLELTEFWSGTLQSGFVTTNNFVCLDLTATIDYFANDYFNGWFVVNTAKANSSPNKYNFITDYAATAGTTGGVFTTKMDITGLSAENWANNNPIKLFRFPVCYTYNAIVPNPTYTDYTNIGTTFKGKPTQFINHQGQLRMPCGKELRPLVLDMIYKRSYFNEVSGSPITYDGFWFDFQQLTQVLYKSYVSQNTHHFATEAGGNHITSNIFLGIYCSAPEDNVIATANMVAFIAGVTLDNRNEVIIAHGIMAPSASTVPKTLQMRFSSWFTRKVTHMNWYSGAEGASGLGELAEYPYFEWNASRKINELPSMPRVSVERYLKGENGEASRGGTPSPTDGGYAYTLDATGGYWYVRFGVGSGYVVPTGFKFLVNTNRFIDQDITMNYTRMTLIPQTNGRFFIIGVKNDVEKPTYENDDAVHFNTLAVGVSCYDIFTRDKYVDALAGDKDYNLDIYNFKGMLMVIKSQRCVFLDVNTQDEIEYRISDMFVGRGGIDYNFLCYTIYGIVVCSKDTVYLLSDKGMIPILTSSNGRLQLYRDTFANQDVNIVYYSEYNELMIFRVNDTNCYTLVYNFQFNQWTDYEYGRNIVGNIKFVKATTNFNKDVLLLNYNSITSYNILKVDESSYVFKNTEGTDETIIWEFETHLLSLANHFYDLNINWISLLFGLKTNSTSKLLVTDTRKVATQNESFATPYSMETLNTSDTKLTGNLFDIQAVESLFQNIKINITNKISSTKYVYKYFSLDAIILWLTRQERQKQNKILP